MADNSRPCSFCDRSDGTRVEGPGVVICAECLTLCFDILAENANGFPAGTRHTDATRDDVRAIVSSSRTDDVDDVVARVHGVFTSNAAPPRQGTLQCSFCGKTQSDRLQFVAGPRVYICEVCMGACAHFLAPRVASKE